MDILIALVLIVAVAALIYFNRSSRSLDINQDDKIDAADAAKAVQNATEGVTQTVKKAAVRAKATAAKKSAAKKPAAKSRAKK
jgi:hypothetical protein